jgi:hypothetical protein
VRMHWRYLRYLCRHKWFVAVAGLRLGVGLWRLLIHDYSKFFPSEWLPYARFFYGPHTAGPKATAAEQRATVPDDLHTAFDVAWLLHQNRQSHHWQFWALLRDDGSAAYLPMPDADRREMLADWRGAGRAAGKPDTRAWYLRNREHIGLHPETRAWVERALGVAT